MLHVATVFKMAAPCESKCTVAVSIKHGSKQLLDMIGTFLTTIPLSEVYKELCVDKFDGFVLQKVHVSPTEGGPWRDVSPSVQLNISAVSV